MTDEVIYQRLQDRPEVPSFSANDYIPIVRGGSPLYRVSVQALAGRLRGLIGELTSAVTTVNGEAGDVTLTALSIGAVPSEILDEPDGVAVLGPDRKIALARLPDGAVTPLQTSGFPQPLGGSALRGTSTQASRSDHVHPFPTPADIGAPVLASTGTPAPLGSASRGTGTTAARSDHVHAMPTAADVGAVTPTQLTDGLATKAPLSHMHDAATADAAGFMTGADRVKLDGIAAGATASPLASSGTPAALGVAARGTATEAARKDHVHAMPSLADLSAAAVDLSNVSMANARAKLGFGGGTANFLTFGNYFVPSAVSGLDYQAFFCQLQASYQPGGTLGVGYFQRVAGYSGGAANDATAPVTPAIRGYTQVQQQVTYCNEVAGLFLTDNYSWLGQGSGIFAQGISREGGRAWGILGEAKEYHKTFTATAGQTTFTIPNGYAPNKCSVTKNNVPLVRGADFTDSNGSTVVLSVACVGGETIRVYRGDPAMAVQACEFGVFVGAGTDNGNTLSGNRIGVNIFGYRNDTSAALPTHIGTLLGIICDPNDASLTVDRGINFQGKFVNGIDFTAANLTFSGHKIKLNSDGAGITAAGNLSIGNLGTFDIAGYGTVLVGHSANGGVIRIGDINHAGRIQASTASGVIFSSETNIDLILQRNNVEAFRLTSSGLGISLSKAAASTSYANDAAAAAGGIPVNGVYRNGSALQIRVA